MPKPFFQRLPAEPIHVAWCSATRRITVTGHHCND
jgi:hypothetical protein